jgi:hypothetical protein
MTDRPLPGKSEPLEIRFWRKVEKGPECWEWLGGGAIRTRLFGGREMAFRKAAWLVSFGELPRGARFVLATCGNRRCVRPEHLVPTRWAVRPSKVSPEDWAQARVRVWLGQTTKPAVARELGLSAEYVRRRLRDVLPRRHAEELAR